MGDFKRVQRNKR